MLKRIVLCDKILWQIMLLNGCFVTRYCFKGFKQKAKLQDFADNVRINKGNAELYKDSGNSM